MSLTCKQLVSDHKTAWDTATRHPFLDGCAAASILPEQFNTWLVQDYLFVIVFTRMAARVLSVAPVRNLDTLLGGLGALKDELNWFREKAAERQLDLNTPKQSSCTAYCAFMAALAEDSYAVQAVAFWAIEAAYNQAWQLPGPMTAPYDEFANRWGNPDFSVYVTVLEAQADEALSKAGASERARAEDVFLKITNFEESFWQMAFAGA